MAEHLNHNDLYRLPWTLPDNAISWLEPTSKCNLYCDGCYRKNEADGHKSLEQVRAELAVFNRLRKTDSVSIAGGDPLTHPQLEMIVETIARSGQKPIINTSGHLLTIEKVRSLKDAGAAGFTFHIDSGQHRPGMKNRNEIELNDLRLKYAVMLAEVGGICCAFNATVYGHTLKYVPDIVDWGQKHIDIVHTLVFIAFRAAPLHKGFKYLVSDREIDMSPIAYATNNEKDISIMSTDILREIRGRFDDFQPCSYLNGTERPDHFKWLLTLRIGTNQKIYGYAGPRMMELAQTYHHFRKGSYLAYTSPEVMGRGRSMLLLSLFDEGIRRTARKYFKNTFRAPGELFKKLHIQTVMIIQPIDIIESGAMSMCDGCPDLTVFNNRLVWSCRLEELKYFGDWVRAVPDNGDEKKVRDTSSIELQFPGFEPAIGESGGVEPMP